MSFSLCLSAGGHLWKVFHKQQQPDCRVIPSDYGDSTRGKFKNLKERFRLMLGRQTGTGEPLEQVSQRR